MYLFACKVCKGPGTPIKFTSIAQLISHCREKPSESDGLESNGLAESSYNHNDWWGHRLIVAVLDEKGRCRAKPAEGLPSRRTLRRPIG